MMDEEALMIELPPGFRFHPTDEEIITHYLRHKVFDACFTAAAISEVDLNKSEPWDLPQKTKVAEKEWYFFCKRDRKYPTGMRTNRATESGYWKATGKDKEIYRKNNKSCLIGMKKTLVFYIGRAPRGEKTNWVMHEYRLDGNYNFSNKVDWVVSRVIHKNTGITKVPVVGGRGITINTKKGELLDYRSSSTLPPLVATDIHNNYKYSSKPSSSSCFTDYKDQLQASDYNNNYTTNVNIDYEFPFQYPAIQFGSAPIPNPSYGYEEDGRQCKVEQILSPNQGNDSDIEDYSALWDQY